MKSSSQVNFLVLTNQRSLNFEIKNVFDTLRYGTLEMENWLKVNRTRELFAEVKTLRGRLLSHTLSSAHCFGREV